MEFLENPTSGTYACQARIHNETSGHFRIYEKIVTLEIDKAPRESSIQILPNGIGHGKNQNSFMRFDRLEIFCKDNSNQTRPKPSVSWFKNGQLIQLLPDWQASQNMPFYAVYPSRRYLPKKTQAVIEFIKEKIGTPCYWDEYLDAHIRYPQ